MENARHPFLRCCGIYARAVIAFSLSLFAIGLTSSTVRAQASDNTAYVRIIHASPYVGEADIFVDGQSLLSAFEFGAVTGYVPIPPGVHHVQVALVGKGINASVISQDLNVAPGTIYTVAALGTALNQLALRGFVDNNQMAAGQARVRFYQLAPNAGPISLAVGDEATLSDMAYAQTSDYLTVDAGPCTFSASGSQSQETKQLTATLKENTITSVFSIGLFKGTPDLQLVYAQTPGSPLMPNTGSDPTPRPFGLASTAPLAGLLTGAGIVLLGSTTLLLNQRRKRQTQRAH